MSNSPYIVEVTQDNFQSLVIEQSNHIPVLVDFWASWCQPCKILMPLLAALAEQYQGTFILAKINTEEQQALAAKFSIRSIPAVKLFSNGKVIDEFAGALPESQIRKFLDKHLPRESDAQVSQAEQLLEQGNTEAAIELLCQAKEQDSTNANIDIALIKAYSSIGDLDQAQELAGKLPIEVQHTGPVKKILGTLYFQRQIQNIPDQSVLEQRLETAENDSEARYQLALHWISKRAFTEALEQLLKLMRQDRKYGNDAAHKAILELFNILGDNPMVPRYRSKMMNLIY